MTEEIFWSVNRDDTPMSEYVVEPCPLCEEPVTLDQINDRATRVGGLGGNRIAHRECLLRSTLGGIGHFEDHARWCVELGDPDGGRTYRRSALEVDEWVHEHGVQAALGLPALLAEDQREWPEGHPCRDCGRLFREHPVTASVLECRDWR